MKTLTNYIKDSQKVNEGLISEIILKLLDASLSWLGSASKFVADNLVNATGELWKSAKGITEEGWKYWADRTGVKYTHPPKNERDLAPYINSLIDERDFDKRNKEIDNFFKDMEKNMDEQTRINMYLNIRMQSAFVTLSDPNATDEQKKAADKILNEVASKNNILKKQIEDFRKNLKKNQPNK